MEVYPAIARFLSSEPPLTVYADNVVDYLIGKVKAVRRIKKRPWTLVQRIFMDRGYEWRGSVDGWILGGIRAGGVWQVYLVSTIKPRMPYIPRRLFLVRGEEVLAIDVDEARVYTRIIKIMTRAALVITPP